MNGSQELLQSYYKEGTRDDSWAFSEEYFEKARDIIFTLLREPEKEKEDITDYVTYTLNTPYGKLITALVYLSLRIARLNGKKGIQKEPKWDERYKNKYDEMLEKKVIEAYTNLGRYLPNLAYLDKSWATDKVTRLASESGTKYWEAFMEGYLSIGKVYDDLYELMRPYYQYGLSYGFKEKRNREHLIQHICIGYLGEHEKVEDPNSLFRKIIDEWKPEQIMEVTGFFEMQREYLTESSEENEKMKGKIIQFWRNLYGKYKSRDEKSLTQQDKKILSSFSRLAVFLPKIETETYEWLMLSATYVHEDFNSSFFIKNLDGLKDKGDRNETAKYIGDIYLRMLDKGSPDYDKKHIRSIIEFLYKAGAQENANRICNIYGSRGPEFLRDIYEKYNKRLKD
jgi:RNA polymerase-interacting CarD/CdnL/TRCF family regulator